MRFRGHTDDIHPLVVSQMTQNHPAGCESLVAQLVHEGEQFDGVVSSVFRKDLSVSGQLSNCSGKGTSPVDNISSLNEEIHISGPMPSLINDPRHFQHLSRIPKVSMKITNSNYPTDERVLRKVPLDVPGIVGDDRRCRGLERLLVTVAEFLDKVWSVTDTSMLLFACLG